MTDYYLPASASSYTDIPRWSRASENIAALSNLLAWFNGNDNTVLTDQNGRLIHWNSRAGAPTRYGRPDIYPGAGSPLLVRNAYRNRNAIRFTRANQDVMQWSGQRATGRVAHTSVIIANLKPAAVGNQFLIGDSTPTNGQNILTLARAGDGTVTLGLNAGPDGSVGLIKDITPLALGGRPILIIASVDGFFNSVKLKINRQETMVFSGDPNPRASDVYIGASGFGDSVRGCDMDLFDHMMMLDDIFADGKQKNLKDILDYAYAAYDIL